MNTLIAPRPLRQQLVTAAWALCLPLVLCQCATTRGHALEESRGDRLGRELTQEIAEIMATNHVYETAVPLLQQGILEDPQNPRLHRLLGTVLRDRGIYDQALTELQTSWRLGPDSADTAAALGVLYDSTSRHDAAELWHRYALDLAPKRADLFNNLGFSMYLQQRDTEAMVTFKEALRFNPNQARSFNNLGFTYFRLGERQLAMQSFAQAGSRAMALANMGVAHELQGEWDGAKRAYESALRLDRRLDVARKNLIGLAHKEAGL